MNDEPNRAEQEEGFDAITTAAAFSGIEFVLFCLVTVLTVRVIHSVAPQLERHFDAAMHNTAGAIIPFLYVGAVVCGMFGAALLGYLVAKVKPKSRVFWC